jgi:hypothetical protein
MAPPVGAGKGTPVRGMAGVPTGSLGRQFSPSGRSAKLPGSRPQSRHPMRDQDPIVAGATRSREGLEGSRCLSMAYTA